MSRASLVRLHLAPSAVVALGISTGALLGCGGSGTPQDMGTSTAVGYLDIQKDMSQKGCLTSACHGNPAGMMTGNNMNLNPAAGMEMANYMLLLSKKGLSGTMASFVDKTTPANSQLLIFPIGTNTKHDGVAAFADMNDMYYTKWLNWIKAGAPYTAPAK